MERIQIANLGPISYSILRWLLPDRRRHQSFSIYFVFVIGTIASFCLATFWDRTSVIFGTERSTALLAQVKIKD